MGDDAGQETIDRQVLAVGIPLRQPDHNGPPGLDEDLSPLEEATTRASEVSRALRGFGYEERQHPGEDWDPADEIRQALKSRRTGMLVVHIVAHGELSGGASAGCM